MLYFVGRVATQLLLSVIYFPLARVFHDTHTHNGRQLWQYHQHPWQQCPSNRAEPSDSTFPSDKFFLHLGTVPSEIESRRDRTLPFFFFFFTIFFFSFPFFIYLNNALFFSPPETGLHINVRARGGEGYCMVTRFLFDMDWVAAWNRLLCSDPCRDVCFLVLLFIWGFLSSLFLCLVIWTDPTGKSKRLSCWGKTDNVWLALFDIFPKHTWPII